MGGEEGAAAGVVVERLDGGPGDRQAIERRGAAADFVEDHQGLGGRAIEDGGGFDHLDHEGGAAVGDVVAGPNS